MRFTNFIFSFVIAIATFFLIFSYQMPTVCDSPTFYSIGTIDNRFNISESQFMRDIEQASLEWETASGKDLFTYDPNATLKVNLVFDERQSLSDQIQTTEQEALQNKRLLDSELAEYNRRSASFEERLRDLNNQIEEWNSRGGAPEEVYNKLKQEEGVLKREADELNALADRLNLDVGTYNTKVNVLNQTEQSLMQVLKSKPEAGLYDPRNNKIDIYFNTSRDELIHTLEHEFGHALGLEHVENPKAIMYSKSSLITKASSDDIAKLRERCRKKTAFERLLEQFEALQMNLGGAISPS